MRKHRKNSINGNGIGKLSYGFGRQGLTTANGCLTFNLVKEQIIYARISTELKRKLALEVANRGEAEAVIVRQALNEYFARLEAGKYRPSAITEDTVSYKSKRKQNSRS